MNGAPGGAAPWPTRLYATGRAELPGSPRLTAWHSDSTPRRERQTCRRVGRPRGACSCHHRRATSARIPPIASSSPPAPSTDRLCAVTRLRRPGPSRRSGRSAGSRVPGGSAGWT
ncbi:hypothetical protein GEV49_37080 [Streptomyces sp. SYP-A7193]|nr:hypothetical protein GEV49_37080 [Streptomyces sp. SYP-A7193]